MILTVFQLVTLPVEFDASKRAKEELVHLGIIQQDEMSGVKQTLDAAAWTYVAAFVTSLSTLLYYAAYASRPSGLTDCFRCSKSMHREIPLFSSISTTHPLIATSPVATVNLLGIPSRNLLKPAGHLVRALTHMGRTSQRLSNKLFLLGNIRLSAVGTWVCVPTTRLAIPSRYQPSAIFSDVASACISTSMACAPLDFKDSAYWRAVSNGQLG